MRCAATVSTPDRRRYRRLSRRRKVSAVDSGSRKARRAPGGPAMRRRCRPARYCWPVSETRQATAGPARSLLKIGEAAERVGLSLRTVRYYEEVGLLTPSARSPGGFRLYSEDDVARLQVLKAMKPFGLSLEEIRELMALLDPGDAGGSDERELGDVQAGLARYQRRAEARIVQLTEHVIELRRLRERIERAASRLGATGDPPGTLT